jgi:5'-nucleotidase
MNSANSSLPPPEQRERIRPSLPWPEIDTVFLDLDGTLLDKHFDDHFWEYHLPAVYAVKHRLDALSARTRLLAIYRSVENTLAWTDLDYWSERLELDVRAEKRAVSDLIGIHPHAREFLEFLCETGKKPHLITNAHPHALQIKLEKIPIGHLFADIICSQDIGLAKEQPQFWTELQRRLDYAPERTLFVDDTEKVLHSAASCGLRHLMHIAKPSSRQPARFSEHYPSIVDFYELLP